MATEVDNVNSGALGTLVAVGVCAMLGISLVVTALVRSETQEEVEKKEVSADRPYRDLLAEQTARLQAPAAYSDRAKGLVSLPIERAMELTVSGLAKDPSSATPPPPKSDKDAGAAAADAGADASAEVAMPAASGAPPAEATGAEPKETKTGAKPPEATPKDQDKPGAAKPEKKALKPAPAKPPTAPLKSAPAPAPPAPAPAPNGQ
jgi:hypothetical protein